MALHYNLAKVHASSENDSDFVLTILRLFVKELPVDIMQLKEAILAKNHEEASLLSSRITKALDFLGMTIAFEENKCIENWAKELGKKKEIIDTFKSLEERIQKAVKEIKKDFNL